VRHQIVVKAARVTTDVGAAVAQKDPHASARHDRAIAHRAQD
jgi:hypothetical protein